MTVFSEKGQLRNKQQGSSEAKNSEQPIRLYGPNTDVFFLHYRFVWALFSREVEVDLPKEDLVMIKLTTYFVVMLYFM